MKHLLWLFKTAYGSSGMIRYGALLLILLYWHLLAIIFIVVAIGVDLLMRSLSHEF